jgi:hypothetical protein
VRLCGYDRFEGKTKVVSHVHADELVRLTPATVVGDFDCGDPDLNEFLRDDVTTYLDVA